MELVNQTYKGINEGALGKSILRQVVESVFLLLSPFTPHISEEVNAFLGSKHSVFQRRWPTVQEKYLKVDKVEIAVLVNGKVREKLEIKVDWTQQRIEKEALSLPKVKGILKERTFKVLDCARDGRIRHENQREAYDFLVHCMCLPYAGICPSWRLDIGRSLRLRDPGHTMAS